MFLVLGLKNRCLVKKTGASCLVEGTGAWLDGAMLPPLPRFFAERELLDGRMDAKNWGRGLGCLIRPIGHLLPQGGEGPLFRSANSGQETPSVNRSRQTWRCSLQNAGSLVAEFQVCDRSHASSSMMSGKSLGRPAACLFFNNVRGEITGIVSPSSSILRLVS